MEQKSCYGDGAEESHSVTTCIYTCDLLTVTNKPATFTQGPGPKTSPGRVCSLGLYVSGQAAVDVGQRYSDMV